MPIIIHKEKEDSIEILPDVMDTPLADAYARDPAYPVSPTMRKLAQLYQIIADRENRYQFHTPPAFGDPEYSRLDGMMLGFILGMGAEFFESSEQIVVKKHGRRLLITDRPTRPQSYHDDLKENARLLNSL